MISVHFLYFKPVTKSSSIEDRLYSIGKTYVAKDFTEASKLFHKENKKVTLVGAYNLSVTNKILS